MSCNNDFVYSSFDTFACFGSFWHIQQEFILICNFLSFIGYTLLKNTLVCQKKKKKILVGIESYIKKGEFSLMFFHGLAAYFMHFHLFVIKS
jgi:hypothetical protein